jgi:hypothetical protein
MAAGPTTWFICITSRRPTSRGILQTIPTTTLLRYDQPAYTTFDASLGVAKGQWTASFSGTNLSSARLAGDCKGGGGSDIAAV